MYKICIKKKNTFKKHEVDLNRSKELPHSWLRINSHEVDSSHHINTMLIKISKNICSRAGKFILKLIWKYGEKTRLGNSTYVIFSHKNGYLVLNNYLLQKPKNEKKKQFILIHTFSIIGAFHSFVQIQISIWYHFIFA